LFVAAQEADEDFYSARSKASSLAKL